MNKVLARVLIAFLLMIAPSFMGCKKENIKNESQIKKIEISKVALDNKEHFETSKMKIEKTWTFDDIKSIKVIWKESVIGKLEPSANIQTGDEYDTYYVKITHADSSIEEWIFWLDNDFGKDGAAENKLNLGRLKLLNKKDVLEIGKLLKD